MQHALIAGRAKLHAELAAALLGSQGRGAQGLTVESLSGMQQLPWRLVQALLCCYSTCYSRFAVSTGPSQSLQE